MKSRIHFSRGPVTTSQGLSALWLAKKTCSSSGCIANLCVSVFRCFSVSLHVSFAVLVFRLPLLSPLLPLPLLHLLLCLVLFENPLYVFWIFDFTYDYDYVNPELFFWILDRQNPEKNVPDST